MTSFLFQAHPVSMVYAGPIFWDAEARAETIMRAYRDFLPNAPEELGAFVGLKTVPSMDPFPREALGQARLRGHLAASTARRRTARRRWRRSSMSCPAPFFNWMGVMPFPAMQGLFDPFFPKGLQWYWKGDFVNALSDEAIDAHIAQAAKAPSELSLMHLYPIDGAVRRVGKDADGLGRARRDLVDGDRRRSTRTRRRPEALKRWGRAYWEAVHPFNPGGAYVNFMMDDEGDAASRPATATTTRGSPRSRRSTTRQTCSG